VRLCLRHHDADAADDDSDADSDDVNADDEVVCQSFHAHSHTWYFCVNSFTSLKTHAHTGDDVNTDEVVCQVISLL